MVSVYFIIVCTMFHQTVQFLTCNRDSSVRTVAPNPSSPDYRRMQSDKMSIGTSSYTNSSYIDVMYLCYVLIEVPKRY